MNVLQSQVGSVLRVAIVGTGFIADFHARGIANAEGVQLVGVCDANSNVANTFARQWGVPAYTSLEEMFAELRLDALHVLTPPDTHHRVAKLALERGIHVFLEKPMCVSSEECSDLLAIAGKAGRRIGVSHSFVYEGCFAKLRQHIRSGDLGPLDHITINLFTELGLIRFGPYTNWMLREPGNTLLEVGPHPISALVDLMGVPEDLDVIADRDVIIPGGARVYRRWRIRATSGRISADVNIELGPGFQQRSVAVRGMAGTAYVDMDANTCTIDRKTASAIDFDRYRRSLSQAKDMRRQAGVTLKDYVLGKAKLGKRSGPFGNSILDSVSTFYTALRNGSELDSRISGEFGKQLIETCELIASKAKLEGPIERQKVAVAVSCKPDVLVLGGTGFIGRALIKQLLERGYAVRAAARGPSLPLEDLGSDRLEILRADMSAADDVEKMLDGVTQVFHLATTDSKTLDQFKEREIEPTRLLARACISRGVKRLIYTGTIDSYYAGRRAGTITEQTPLDSNRRRNNYSRTKTIAEGMLSEMHRQEGLPLVIVRPGIVIGKGGNPFHWGVGKWATESVVQTWGQGTNMLPLVLVDDVANGLVLAMETEGIEGRSYNLIDKPMLSARDYVAAVERLAAIRITTQGTPIWKFFLDDFSKWPVKWLVGHPDGGRIPSYFDWESRTQKAYFDCSRTRAELGWSPISDPEKMVTLGIGSSLASWLAARE